MDKYLLKYRHYRPDQEGLREALCTLGNGYFATRGAAEWAEADGIHYPGTYLAGGYNRLTSRIRGRDVVNEDLVNFPNWLPLNFRIGSGPWFHPKRVKILSYQQHLNMKKGIMTRKLRFVDPKGRRTRLVSSRLVHMEKPHLAAIEWTFTPENWSGKITIRSGIDGGVRNTGVARYRALNNRHLKILKKEALDSQTVGLLCQTNQSRLEVAMACVTRPVSGRRSPQLKYRTVKRGPFIGKDLQLKVSRKQPVKIEKILTLYSSRDPGLLNPWVCACREIQGIGSFKDLSKTHRSALEYLWDKFDIHLEEQSEQELILRVHNFHLFQSVSPNSVQLDVGVPARGIHGEAYRGHVFWDELFIFPIFNLRYSAITRSLLLYRYHRLDMARRLAKESGFRGAMFPWQSGSDGSEETQTVHLNPKSGRWIPDKSHRQRHVNLAIVFNVWQYFSITQDISFLTHYGAEMFLEIARFFSSITHFSRKTKRYEIHGIMGPDEYHEEYPYSHEPGLRNNAYTNVMVAWLFRRAFDILEAIPTPRRKKLLDHLSLTQSEIKKWQEIPHRMFVPFHDGNIISQFEGYEELKEFDWEGYRLRYGNIARLDRILEAEGDSPKYYKLSKQADVLMLFYLLPYKNLKEIFSDLGYSFNRKLMRDNVDYYLARTSHGSTLSQVVHATILNLMDREEGWEYFNRALASDVADIQGGTTPEGIHLGAMAGTVDIVLREFAGFEVRKDTIHLNPRLPKELPAMDFKIQFRLYSIKLIISHQRVRVCLEADGKKPLSVVVKNIKAKIKPGSCKNFSLSG